MSAQNDIFLAGQTYGTFQNLQAKCREQHSEKKNLFIDNE